MITITNKREFYEEIADGVPVIADFTAFWCAPCKLQTPILSELESGLNGKVKIIKIDVDENAELADELKVKAVPTMLIYKNGKLADKSVGLSTKAVLSEKLIGYL